MKNTMLEPLYNTLIGFENLMNRGVANYPPYNLIKSDDDNYLLEIAVSGFHRSELEVVMTGNKLEVRGTKTPPPEDDGVPQPVYLVRGLAHRSWTRSWTLEDNIEVKSVALVDGILTIRLTPHNHRTGRSLPIA